MLADDVLTVQKLKEELLEMKVKYKDAIDNYRKYQDCMTKVA